MRPFVIVGMPRTGSTLLLRALQQHSDVVAYGELFHWVESERSKPYHAIARDGALVVFDPKGDPANFLSRWVWCPENAGRGAVGFKVFAEHAVNSAPELFQRVLAAWEDLHVIHILRPNYLDVFVSWLMAQETGQWFLEPGEPSFEAGHFLEPATEDVEAFFAKMRSADQFFSEVFSGRQYLQVQYSSLAQNLQMTMDDIFAFLGVEPCPVRADIRKQSERRPSEILANYAKLKKHFKETEFGALFPETVEDAGLASRPPEKGESGMTGPLPAWKLLSGKQLQFSQEYHEKPRGEILPLLPPYASAVLDVGCGTGITSLLVAERYPEAKLLGIEIQTEARDVAATRLAAVSSHDLQAAPMPASFAKPGSIDLVLLLDVLEHMNNPWQALINLRPSLAPDASVIISIPNARCLAFLEPVAAGSVPYGSCGLFDVTHIRFFTKTDVEAMLEDAGFQVEDAMPLAYPESMMPRIVDRSWRHVETENLIIKHGAIDGYNELFAGQWLFRATPIH